MAGCTLPQGQTSGIVTIREVGEILFWFSAIHISGYLGLGIRRTNETECVTYFAQDASLQFQNHSKHSQFNHGDVLCVGRLTRLAWGFEGRTSA